MMNPHLESALIYTWLILKKKLTKLPKNSLDASIQDQEERINQNTNDNVDTKSVTNSECDHTESNNTDHIDSSKTN